ncbi:MAG TPA: tetratricopeptide repeat protein [Roseiflexaceae bacterium]|nr:tetratricopeptide repeat protein [Roseiflexaceae bacterium]HMP42539.1 tetratricopeptide repeat protein [Roseiflexaceae bacterium]
MTSPADTFLPPPPQTGRSAPLPDPEVEQRGLWSQLLTAFRDLSGAFDAFANDANPQVRALGRAARQRRQPQTNDYFALGDMCARLTAQGSSLSETYAAKTLAAYAQAAAISQNDAHAARRALVAFGFWVADAARSFGGYEALKVGVLVIDRVMQLVGTHLTAADRDRLTDTRNRLRDQMNRIFDDEQDSAVSDLVSSERESRMLCDQGQMLLRQGQPQDAYTLFERSLQLDDNNHAAWLWRAMSLTDLGRFEEALASYDKALALEPDSAGVWNNKGSLLMELGRLDAALQCFERALELSAAVSTVKAVYWLNKGKALYMLARYQEARDALVRSHQLDPSPESAAGIAACRERLDTQRG